MKSLQLTLEVFIHCSKHEMEKYSHVNLTNVENSFSTQNPVIMLILQQKL